jgi:hypothetical protein
MTCSKVPAPAGAPRADDTVARLGYRAIGHFAHVEI